MNKPNELAHVYQSIAGYYVDYPSNQEPYDAPYTKQRFYYESEEEAYDVLCSLYSIGYPACVEEPNDLPF